MIIHYNHDKPRMEYVVNSRLPVYKVYYGDGLGNIIAGLFTRMAPKVAPMAKQLGMKAIDIIRDKGLGAVGDLAGRAFSTARDKIVSLAKSRFGKKPVVLPSTAVMPANISKAINNVVKEKLESLVAENANNGSASTAAIMNAIAGSGLRNASVKSAKRGRQKRRR
jgi:hypothetical protein